MFVFCNVGRRKSGKTHLTKQLLNKLKKKGYTDFLIYDPNGEYTEFYTGELLPIKDFLKKAVEVKDTIVVFEEATIFFRHAPDEEVLNLCVRSRHRKGEKGLGNFIIFNFHSLRSVPLYILDHLDVIQIKKTNDNTANVKTKFKDFPEVWGAFLMAQNSKEPYFTAVHSFYL
jgi:hypothetical protein